MGQDVADMHANLHGEGTTHHLARIRLHWGDEGIDETHTMADATWSYLLGRWAASDGPGFRAACKSWILANASSAAQAEADAFAAAGWEMMP